MEKPPLLNILVESDERRKKIIKKIQEITEHKLIVYTANLNISPNSIDHNDIRFFNDLLQSIKIEGKIDLMISSPGGEPNAAEKIAMMCREYCDTFRVIVPNYAKSAATMIALATDSILMGYLSEIGPIDPQIRIVTPRGTQYIPAQSVIDSVKGLQKQIIAGVPPVAIIPLLQQIEPPVIDLCLKAIEFSRQFAERWLSKYMLRHDPEKAKQTAKDLSDNTKWLSHGKIINKEEAKALGLRIEEMPKDSELWKLVWELYCRSEHRLNIEKAVKMYENENHQFLLHMEKIP